MHTTHSHSERPWVEGALLFGSSGACHPTWDPPCFYLLHIHCTPTPYHIGGIGERWLVFFRLGPLRAAGPERILLVMAGARQAVPETWLLAGGDVL